MNNFNTNLNLLGFCLSFGILALILLTFQKLDLWRSDGDCKRNSRDFRQSYSLNKNWKQKSTYDLKLETKDQLFPLVECSQTIHSECLNNIDDKDWKTVTLPHDFVVEAEHNQSEKDKEHGYLPLGYSWYRKRFVNPNHQHKEWRLHFEGCMWLCHVYLNEMYLGNSTAGYLPFWFDVQLSDMNTLVVLADAAKEGSWWYDGGGLYRSVQLIPLNDIRIVPYGVYVPSHVTSDIIPETEQQPARANANVMVFVDIECLNGCKDQSNVIFELLDDAEEIINVEKITLPPFNTTEGYVQVTCNMTIKNAKLWSIQHPSLYSMRIRISSGSTGIFQDGEQTTIGIRKLAWDPDMGFFLNDENVKILGVANHQDFAGVGVAVPDSLQSYRVSKIQELGGNAWRTAHNPPNPALLDATDRMGMLVWDENYRNGEVEQAKILVKRDRNHPSIIIWSICNEILCDLGDGADSELSLQQAHEIKRAFQELDPYGQRVVSANQNAWIVENNNILDLLGFDYSTDSYDRWHGMIPNRPAISSETSSAVGDRGEYFNDWVRGHIREYGTETMRWGQTTEKAWGGYNEQNTTNTMGILTRSFVAGGFTWTGFDYRGEPTPYGWPDVSSHFGIYDTAGFEKDRVGWYKSWWPLQNKKKDQLRRSEMNHLHVFPHWNWATTKEETIQKPYLTLLPEGILEVRVYSNAAAVELYRNGVIVGECRIMPKYGHLAWNVTYESGNITARSYHDASSCEENKNNKVALQEMARVTTGPPSKLLVSWSATHDGTNLAKSRDSIQEDQVLLLRVDIADSSDRIVPLPNEYPIPVTFTIMSNSGRLLGTGNGDPSDLTNDKSPTRNAYHGSVLGLIQATIDVEIGMINKRDSDNCGVGSYENDLIEIVVSSEGFEDVVIQLPIRIDRYQQPSL